MNKTVVKILLGILLFFYIYNPPLIFFPLNSGIIIGGICFVFFLARLLVQLSLSKEIKLNRRILAIAGIISLLVLYSCLIPVLMGSADFQLAKNYLSFLLFHLPGAFGITELFKKHISITTALKIFVSVTALQAIIMIAMLVSPDIKNFFFSILRDADARLKQNQISGGFRFLGFALGGSWDLSIVQSMGIMSIALLAKTGCYKISLKTALLFLLLLVSVFLAGRTGIFGILLALILLLVPVKATEVPFYKITKLLVF